MNFGDIRWSFAAMAALKAIPWRHAERVDAAVQRFALRGLGNVHRVRGSRHGGLILRVPPYSVYVELDEEEGLLRVFGIFRG